jgi:hypothetical protein
MGFYDAFDDPPKPPGTVHLLRPVTADAEPYALAALNAEVERVATAANGSRNHTLNRATFSLAQLVAGGALTEQTVREHLEAAAHTCGLDATEITATIDSGFRGGLQHPRGVPEPPQPFDVPAVTVLDSPPGGVDAAVTVLDSPPGGVDAAVTVLDSPPGGVDAAERPRTSWYFRDLGRVLSGDEPDITPEVLRRTDDAALFYPGRVNGLIGESESGKTWVALLAVAQALADGRPVLYLDFEDSAAGIIGRLKALGVTDEQLARFAYVDPDEGLGQDQQIDLTEVLAEHQPDLVVTDGFNAAMTLLGLNLESNTDATRFAQKLLKPLSATGATVVYIDHVPKNKDNQSKGGIGAQAKRAMTTGCALRVEVTQEFGRGMTGRLRLVVDKDRPGLVRAVSGGAKNAGTAVLESHSDGRVEMRIDAPDLRPADERGPFRPTALMQRVSLFLLTVQGEGVSGAAIEREVHGNAKAVRQAVEMLVQEGYVSRRVGPRNAVLHRSVRPFLDNSLNMDLTSSTSSAPRPTSSETRSAGPAATSSARPSPYGEDEVDEVSGPAEEPADLVPDVRARIQEIRESQT